MKKDRKLNYFSALFKKGYLLYALLFTCIALTVMVFCSENDLFAKIAVTTNWNVFLLCGVGVYFAIGLWYSIASLRKYAVNMSDCLIVTVLTTTLLYLAYRLAILKSFNLIWIIVLAVILIGCAVIFALKVKGWKDHHDQSNPLVSTDKPSFNNYYKALFAKFNVFTILCISLVEVCALLMLACPPLRTYVGFFKMGDNIVTIAICAILPFAYIISKTNSKRTAGLDALLLSSAIALIILLPYVFLTHGLSIMLLYWAAAFVLVAVFFVLRFMCFDFTLSAVNNCVVCQKPLCQYVKKNESEYGFLSALSLGSILALAFSHVFTPYHLYTVLVKVAKTGMIANPAFFPVVVLLLAVYLTIAIFGLFALMGTPSKKIHFGDFSAVTLSSFAVFSLICAIDSFSYTRTALALVCLLVSLSIVFARVKKIKE